MIMVSDLAWIACVPSMQAAGLLDTVSDDGWRVFGFADLDEPEVSQIQL